MAGIGGILRTGALVAETGLTIADIINTETDGEAYYPSIKENKKKLSELEPILDNLKVTYIADYNAYNLLRSNVGDINAKAVVLLAKMGQVFAKAAEAQELANEFFEKKVNESRVVTLPKVSGVYFQIIDVAGPILAFGDLAWKAMSIVRASNSAKVQFSSLRNHLSNVLKQTDLPTSALLNMKISKVDAGMIVLGLGMAATNFGLNIKEAEIKRDKYNEFVEKVQNDKADIEKNIKEISEKSMQIQDIFDNTIESLKAAFKNLEDQASIDKLEACGKEIDKINSFIDEMTPKIDAITKGIELNREELRLMGLVDSLIPVLASSGLNRSNFIEAIKSVKPDIKDEKIAALISGSKVHTPEIIQKALEQFNHKP